MRRLETLGLLATLAAVTLLVGSLLVGLRAEGEPDSPPLATAVIADEPGERVRVEVLNAAGTPGLARAATRLLRERSFDVVYFGNAGSFGGDTSWVIDRVGRLEDAQRVADALRIARVRSAPDTTLFLEVTVVLGRDWEGGAAARGLEPYRATAGAP